MPARSNSPRIAGLDGGPPIRTPDPNPNEAERFMPRLSVDLARWFLERAGVACVPGSAFGLDPFLRLVLRRALRQHRKGLHAASRRGA